MSASSTSLLSISMPFGQVRQVVNSTRYSWDNANRGNEHFVILQRTISGAGEFTWQGVAHRIPPGHAFIAITPEPSSYAYPAGERAVWEFSWLNFYGELAVRLCEEIRARYGPVLPLPEQTVAAAAFDALVAQAESRALRDRAETSTAIFAFLMEWTRVLQAPDGAAPDPVSLAARICRARFREPIGTKELAAETGVSREHLSRLFSEARGISPGRYLRSLRVQAARDLLRDSSLPLQEVALRCGFPSLRALHRALQE